jgi:hypothetical protein
VTSPIGPIDLDMDSGQLQAAGLTMVPGSWDQDALDESERGGPDS